MTTAYPLQWPLGWPRTPTSKREPGRFSRREVRGSNSWASNVELTLHQALSRVQNELSSFTRPGRNWRVPPGSVIVSTMLQTRQDGLPRSGQRKPEDPGVAVYFELDGVPKVIPCDRYATIEQNLAAVAATLSALRALERHGSGIMERAFTGFEALPHLVNDPWWVVLQVPEDAPAYVVEKSYKVLRSQTHPDKLSGDATQFQRVQEAWETFQREEVK